MRSCPARVSARVRAKGSRHGRVSGTDTRRRRWRAAGGGAGRESRHRGALDWLTDARKDIQAQIVAAAGPAVIAAAAGEVGISAVPRLFSSRPFYHLLRLHKRVV